MFKLKKILSLSIAMSFGLSIIPNVTLINNEASAATANIIKIDPSLQYQTMDGWGTSLTWWGKLVGDWNTEAKNEIMDLTFDKDKGLGLNMVRYNIGGSTSPWDTNLRPGGDIESFLLPDGTYDWTKDAGQRWTLNEAKNIVENGGDKFVAEAFSNSPPYFMTKSGHATGYDNWGSSNLDSSKYGEFADYLTNVTKHFNDEWGITFDTLEPMNEPSSGYWKKNGNQEGCVFKSADEKDGVYQILSEKIKNAGLTTKIAGFDETNLNQSINSINSVTSETLDTISQINTHVYSGSNSERIELRDKAATLKKPLYMNEVCIAGPSWHNHENMENGLQLAQIIFNDLRYMKVPAWDIWQVVDDEPMNQEYSSNWGLIHAYWEENADSENYEKYFLTKQYYAMAHFSKYIRPGYIIIDSNNDDVVAAIDPVTNNLVLVTKNESDSDKALIFDLSKFNTTGATVKSYTTTDTESLAEDSGLSVTNGSLNDTLPAKSMVTYVISNAVYSGEIGTTINDNVRGNDVNQFDYSGSWSYYGSQSGAYSNDVHYTNTKDDYCQVKFNGNRIKLYGTYGTDAGIAAISIDGVEETMVDLYDDKRSDNALIYTSPLLNGGNHTIKIMATGEKNDASTSTFLTVDSAVALEKSTDNLVLERPQLIDLTGGINSIHIKFNAVAGATSYNIKYGKVTGEYTEVINNIKGTSYTIPDLEEGTEYYVVVSAIVNDVESENSNELSETTYSLDSNMIYYVNCGDETADILESGEKIGTFNSKEDQPYGQDSLTGYNWGYISDENKTWSQDKQNEYGAGYGCLRQYDGSNYQGGLTYKFEIPNGKYSVIMGFYDPWDHDGRLEDILINEELAGEELCPKTIGKISQTYTADVKDGVLTVRAQSSVNASDKPIISWVKVIKEDVSYNVIYDANGGEGNVPIDDINYSVGDIVRVKENTLTNTGYTFVGWNTSADGSGTNYDPTDIDNNTLIIEESNVTLYAQWKADTPSVTTPAAVEIIRNGDNLTAKLKKANGSEFNTNEVVTYEWYRDNELVDGENDNTYELSDVDNGTSIKVKVDQYGLVSKAVEIPNDPTDDTTTPSAVRIKGSERVGNTLSCEFIKDGKVFSIDSNATYKWYRLSSKNSEDGKLIGEGETYKLVSSDKSQYIKLVAIYKDIIFEDITSNIQNKESSSSSNSSSSSTNNSSQNNSSSTKADGWTNNSDKTWKFIKDGKAVNGWNQINGKWYLMDSNGNMETGWKESKGNWYLLRNDGAMATGWQQVNNKWYLLKNDGVMATGWQQVNNKWYLLKNDGVMATGWQQVNNKWYLLKNDGAMATGWQQVNNKWYLLKNDGAMEIGWKESNGRWYYLYSDGSMASNTIINGFKVDKSGAWVE